MRLLVLLSCAWLSACGLPECDLKHIDLPREFSGDDPVSQPEGMVGDGVNDSDEGYNP